MGRKLGLNALFCKVKNTNSKPSSPPPWLWPSCNRAKTYSFRTAHRCHGGEPSKIMNTAYLLSTESFFTSSSAGETAESFSTAPEAFPDDSVEAIMRGLSSDRLFFEPGVTSSLLKEEDGKAAGDKVPFEGGVAMVLHSKDPYRDFKVSMEEMVMAHGVKDWRWLEEMLGWYLSVNGERTHRYIVGAFVDLLLEFVSLPLSSSSSSSSSSSLHMEEEGDTEYESC